MKMLDQSMTYSSAIFDQQNTNLSDAQLNKYKIIVYSISQ